MEKAELKERLDKIVCQIKANSKDAHFANKLIDEALSLKGQLGIDPTLVYIPVDSVVESIEGNTFTMYTTTNGEAVYHVYGGYTVIADARSRTLNGTIRDLINMVKNAPDKNDEDKKNYDIILDAACRVLNIPYIAFSDGDFMLDVAKLYVEKEKAIYEKYMAVELQEPTPEADAEFEEATKTMVEMEKELDEIKKKTPRKSKTKADGKS